MHCCFKFSLLFSVLFFSCVKNEKNQTISFNSPEGMIWIEGKSYTKGAKKMMVTQ